MKIYHKYNCVYFLEHKNKDYIITDINNFPFKNVPALKRHDFLEMVVYRMFHKNI